MIRNYRQGDAQRVRVQTAQRAEARQFAAEFDHIPAFTLAGDVPGRPVLAVFGYRPDKASGTAECFALVGADAGPYLLQAVRFLRRAIASEARRSGIRRVTMTVREGFAPGMRLARLLGFIQTGVLPDFFNQETYLFFERMEHYGITDGNLGGRA